MSSAFGTLNAKVIKRFPPGVWLLMAVNLFITIGFSIAIPFLALYLHDVRGLSMSVVGAIFLISGLCNAGTNLVGGMLSDRLGRRRLMLMIMVASVFAYAALAALTGIMAPVWLITVAYVAARSVLRTINPTVAAIAADLSPRERLTETYAFIRIGGNVGFSLGPAMGGYLLAFLSYGWLVSVSAMMCIIATVLIVLFLKESFTGSGESVDFRSTIAVARDRPFLIFIVFSVLLMLSISHLGSTLSVFSVDRMGFSAAQYGLLLTTNGYPSNAVALWGIIASVSVLAAGGFVWWGIVMRRKTAIPQAAVYR